MKHGHFYSSILSDSSADYISPLFRAELYNGILPEEYQFMEEIRIQLFRNEGLSGELDKFFFNNIRSFYVKQSYRISGDDTCVDQACIDGICKKDLMAFFVKRCWSCGFAIGREDSRIIIALSTALHAMLKAGVVFSLPGDEAITLTIADTCYMMQVPLSEVC